MDFVKSADSPAESLTARQLRSASEKLPFKLIHLSDFHLCRINDAVFSALLNKRALSGLAWCFRRSKENLPQVLELLAEELKTHAWDQLVVTGDLSHLGLYEEFCWARIILDTMGPPEKLFVVPGNHDALVKSALPYFKIGLEKGGVPLRTSIACKELTVPDYPVVRVQSGVALIGLSSAQPTPPFSARGRLGELQRSRLAEHLARFGAQGVFRIVLIHHPVVARQVSPRKQLEDREDLAEILNRHGAELVLHGHAHRVSRGALPGPVGSIPVFGLPSASSIHPALDRRSCFRQFIIEPLGDGWEVRVQDFRLNQSAQAYCLSGQERLHLTCG